MRKEGCDLAFMMRLCVELTKVCCPGWLGVSACHKLESSERKGPPLSTQSEYSSGHTFPYISLILKLREKAMT